MGRFEIQRVERIKTEGGTRESREFAVGDFFFLNEDSRKGVETTELEGIHVKK